MTRTAHRALARYRAKRNFDVTPEPAAGGKSVEGALQFVVQKHWASHLHYDFRLELDGTMKSWAVPKGPSLDPHDKRMAVHVEDHPVSYNTFEGTIPEKQYGAGKVIVWDRGVWEPLEPARKGYRQGKLKFVLHGHKLKGAWALVRMRTRDKQDAWLLIKEKDEHVRAASEFSVVDELPDSVSKVPAKVKRATHGRSGDLQVSHPERVVDPTTGVRKIDIVRYYARIAPLMLPHLKLRPVSLVKAPQGIRRPMFFQKHLENTTMDGVSQVKVKVLPKHAPYLVVDSALGLLSAAQMNTIEFHTWNGTTKRIDRPDRFTLDLDPGKDVTWAAVRQGAELVRGFLDQIGLAAYLKTSGGKGLHLVTPIRPQYDWDTVKAFTQAVVQHLADTLPERFVAKSGPKNRVGRIFVDYLRNGLGATTVAAWSVRGRPGLGISVPVDWDELPRVKAGDHWTIASVDERLDVGNEPWKSLARSARSLTRAMKRIDFDPDA